MARLLRLLILALLVITPILAAATPAQAGTGRQRGEYVASQPPIACPDDSNDISLYHAKRTLAVIHIDPKDDDNRLTVDIVDHSHTAAQQLTGVHPNVNTFMCLYDNHQHVATRFGGHLIWYLGEWDEAFVWVQPASVGGIGTTGTYSALW